MNQPTNRATCLHIGCARGRRCAAASRQPRVTAVMATTASASVETPSLRACAANAGAIIDIEDVAHFNAFRCGPAHPTAAENAACYRCR